MKNKWDTSAVATGSALDEIIYGSRLIGSDPALVLHGGGNTSIKTVERDLYGDDVAVLHVKGSGWDLGSIEASGFTPLRIERLRRIIEIDALSDSDMMNELRLASLDSRAPDPSVESLLHALLPARAVMHSHADAILAITNQPDGEARIRGLYGDRLVVVPYVMPGFDLAKAALAAWTAQSHKGSLGMVLMNHGLFTTGATAEEAYARHIELITEAEELCFASVSAAPTSAAELPAITAELAIEIAEMRRAISELATHPVLLSRFSGPAVANFVARSDLAEIAGQGPLTPDHVIRTKRIPLIGRNLAAYAATYAAYVAANKLRRPGGLTELTGEPRVIVDPELGLLIVGDNAREMSATADVYAHTIDVIDIASRMSGYQALPAGDIFDVEYWELEQAKLSRERSVAVLGGEIALVTGAASGIGRAIASALLAAGAAVVGLDLDGAVVDTFSGPAWFGLACDVTDDEALQAAVLAGVERFGGLDIVVPAAGVFGKSQPIAELDLAGWKRSMDVNAGSIVALLKYVHPYLKRSPDHGRVVLIASKNVVAPGPGASSYSSSKTAAVQVARVAALEWAEDGIRVNMVHPDAVFDTALWTPDLLKERAAKYGLSEEAYKTRNLLRTEVTSAIVANVVRDLCTDVYRATTGAQIPIDGGNERVV